MDSRPVDIANARRFNRRGVLQAGMGLGALAAFGRIPAEHMALAAPALQATPTAGGSLVAAASGDIQFDPYYRVTAAWFPMGTMYNALYDYSDPNSPGPVPSLAESDEETDTELTVKLKQGVMFHNGRELTAQDVVDNIERAKDESIGHFLTSYFGPTVESTEVIDDYTVKITYTKPYALKRDDLATLFLLPKEAMADIATKPVGTGPFSFVSYAPGDHLELARFDDYFLEDQPLLDNVDVRILPDPQARVANLLSGDINVSEGIAESDISRLEDDPAAKVAQSPLGGYWHTVVFNTERPALENKQVRQALNYSLDRDKISQLAWFGLAPVTQGRYTPDNFWYHEPAATMYSFDLEKAKALLAEAGFADGFSTTISVSEANRPGSKALAQVWAQDLATIGVTLEIIEKEQNAFYDDYFNEDYDIQVYLLGDGLFDPATAINDSSPLRPEENRANIQTQPFYEEYKKLVEDGVSTIDPEQRKPIYDRIQEIWAEESWSPILAFSLITVGLSENVAGFALPPGGGYDLAEASFAAD
ncbi:MAG: ABC transporter substrate-binding protein [Thermomicrobiales bacterium]|jgi:peptide/nickel transport system substrate-binding protein